MKPDLKELAAATEIYERALANSNLCSFDISGLDRIGTPIYVAALRAEDGFSNDGFGYGGSSAEAVVGALGEMNETYHTHYALMRAPACEGVGYREMVNQFGVDHVIDPCSLVLSAGYPYHDHLPLRWVAVKRWEDGADCWAPRETVAPGGSSYATQSTCIKVQGKSQSAQLFPAITCGLGAGLTVSQALSHGVLELLQRDGNCTSFRAMDRGIDIELDYVESNEIKTTLKTLESLGLRIRPKLASTEFGLVNLYVIAEPIGALGECEPFSLLATACGEAVHANRERALRKALQEYLASRCRKVFMHGPLAKIRQLAPKPYIEKILETARVQGEEPKAIREMANWLGKTQGELRTLLKNSVFSSRETVKFSTLSTLDDRHVVSATDRLIDVSKRLKSESISIYYFDASPSRDDGPRVIKAIAPGLEGETLSYWRIGGRGAKRLIARNCPLVAQGEPRPQDLPIHLSDIARQELGGPVFFRIPEWEKILHNHYPLYREPSSHTVQQCLTNP